MKSRSIVSVASITVVALIIAPGPPNALASPTGGAPTFDLPSFYGEYYSSSQIFRDHSYTFLVFWDSGCPECVEALNGCEYFYNEHAGEGVAVVGIHMDTGRMSDAQAIVEQNGITILQLWDVGGEAAQAYDVPVGAFTLVLVDGNGRILGERRDTGAQTENAMSRMLSGSRASPGEARTDVPLSGDTPEPERAFTFHGDARLRFLSVDSRGAIPSGPFGEDVRPGNDLLYRFEMELSRRITRRVRVGGLLRISNEGEEVLAAGPKYLGREWGSAFAEMIAGPFSTRLGYFAVAMTPLTLMRWDWNDNPRFGGTAGCGCGAAAGVLLIESLEELDTDLVFEGGIVSHRYRGVESRIFYGIPRRADETPYLEYRSTGRSRAQYALETAGFESAWRRYDDRTGGHWSAGVRAVAGWEDPRSVDYAGLGYPAADPWFQSGIVSIDAAVPVHRYVALTGEYIVWNKTVEKGLVLPDGGDRRERNANGGLAGILIDGLPHLSARADYIRLDPGYFTPFSALSYIPNAEGGRASGKLSAMDDRIALSLFYKRLYEINTPDGTDEKRKDSLFGVSLDLEWPSGAGGSVGWMDEGAWRDDDTAPVDESKKSLFAGARWRFRTTTHLELQYQRVETKSDVAGSMLEGETNLYSVYFRAEF